MSLERSINNLCKRVDRFDPVSPFSNRIRLSNWKGKPIIPLDEWIVIRNTPFALRYFPDDFDQDLTYIPEDEAELNVDDAKRNSDYLKLMEYTRNPNYGRLKCFRCLLSPDGDDPIFIGMNRLIAKGLNPEPEYPCRVANRFRCPYVERCDGKDARFDIGDLYRLGELSFAVEVSLAKARRNDSVIKIRNKEDLLHALTNKEIFHKILEQGTEGHEVGEWAKACLRENMAYILNYFVKIKDKIIPEELRLF